ncbi:hypothetical protein AK812_SmicGene13918 [Symbiodinium microadriaticum]|uniref:Uncharacterized protein n=1 Tax=Symbiodinium microadriaticum TaxID=2951 RepID=A0A1Q9E6V2_SYMMI|nr:hypothetical protein AK812_SmicGene13918 [Symbiodinium microadriaticum]
MEVPDARIEPVDEFCTTLILRGLNRQITREMIVGLVEDTSPNWHYAKPPGNPKKELLRGLWGETERDRETVGERERTLMKFVNFDSPVSCKEYMRGLQQDRRLARLSTYHVRSVGQAPFQGRGTNLEAVLSRRGRQAALAYDGPLVFDGGRRVALEDVVASELPGMLHLLMHEPKGRGAEAVPGRADRMRVFARSHNKVRGWTVRDIKDMEARRSDHFGHAFTQVPNWKPHSVSSAYMTESAQQLGEHWPHHASSVAPASFQQTGPLSAHARVLTAQEAPAGYRVLIDL